MLTTICYSFDSSVGRGDLTTKIGLGSVIRGLSNSLVDATLPDLSFVGWDEGILGTDTKEGMSLGEKANLVISA